MSDTTMTMRVKGACGEKLWHEAPSKARKWTPAVRYLLVAMLTTSTPALFAEQGVYRSVDKHGNVTYSSTPLKGSVETQPVKISPGPSEPEREAARKRLERTEAITQQLADDRKARAKERQRTPKAIEEPEEEMPGPSSTTSSDDEPLREVVRDGLRDRVEESKGEGAPGTPVRIQPVPYPIRKPPPAGGGATGRGAAAQGKGGRGSR